MQSMSKQANAIRLNVLNMTHRANASHIGSCLSIADLLAVLYFGEMKVDPADPSWNNRDRFILSKGHAAAAVYACLAMRGFIPTSDLDTYGADGSQYMTHISHKIPGVEFSSGSLGHGLPFAVGKALALKSNLTVRVFALLSDGELDEGSNWEALMFAAHHKLCNLIVIVDYNKLQSLDTTERTLGLEPLVAKFTAFGANVVEVDGHDHIAIGNAFMQATSQVCKPTVILAHTTKGKGVSFMENKVEWHYKSPNAEQLLIATQELEKSYA